MAGEVQAPYVLSHRLEVESMAGTARKETLGVGTEILAWSGPHLAESRDMFAPKGSFYLLVAKGAGGVKRSWSAPALTPMKAYDRLTPTQRKTVRRIKTRVKTGMFSPQIDELLAIIEQLAPEPPQ